MQRPIYILNGPNLNRLGTREPSVYGAETLEDVEAACKKSAETVGFTIVFRQTNHEGELLEWVQEAVTACAALVMNAGAYTHTSIALLDALKMLDQPIIEVHLSNVFRREDFRAHSYVSLAATGVICGLGITSYVLGIHAAASLLKK